MRSPVKQGVNVSMALGFAVLASCTPSSAPAPITEPGRGAANDAGNVGANDVEPVADASVGSVGAPPDCEPMSLNALQRAFDAVDVQSCKRPKGPTGAGRVELVYVPKTGQVRSILLQRGPFSGTPEGTCVVAAFRATTIPPFCPGDASPVIKPFVIH